MPIAVTTRDDGPDRIVAMAGSMSPVDSLDLHAKLLPTVPDAPSRMIFDLSGVSIMPSLGIGTMMSFVRALEAKGHVVRFAAAQPNVQEVIARCKLDTIWRMHPTVEAAQADG
jgi:anti-anti-sigma factor